MSDSNIRATSIEGLYTVHRKTFADDRGFFREVFHLDELREVTKVEFTPVQFNHSHSAPRVIRGLHAENWNKLVYPAAGTMFAAIVDIRPDSPTFARVETFSFSEEEKYALFIRKGLANSICVLGEVAVDYLYLVDSYYDGSDSYAIAWDDPDLAIKWPVANPIISQRDKNNPKLRDIFPEKFA